jgi:hypothetical protein
VAKRKLSRDQRRKKKLKQRSARQPAGSLAYHGKRYRREEYVLTLARAEIGIYQTFVMTERQLADRHVEAAIKQLIGDLRARGYQSAVQRDVVDVSPDAFVDLVIWNIRRNWDELFETEPRHSDADLAGVLRTILGSVETWSTPSPDSRGYLNYIKGFLGQMGIHAEMIPMEAGEPEEEFQEASDEDALLEMGMRWLETGSRRTKASFYAAGQAMIDAGQANAVINVCQTLIGQINDEVVIEELHPLLQPAYAALGVPFEYRPQRRRKGVLRRRQ